MIIDFHTHIYPDRIAEHAMSSLRDHGGHYVAFTNGTLQGLKASMEEAKVDISVVLPVATKPSQFESINKFAKIVDETEKFRSFGGLHPLCENLSEKLDIIKNLGLRGIKLHPEYQGVPMDDPLHEYIVSACIEKGLYVTFHSGFDPAYPTSDRSTAIRAYRLIDKLAQHYDMEKDPHVILAHLGSNEHYDDTEKYLVDLPVYFDLSNLFGKIDNERIAKIIKKHGCHRTLFATDSPWHNQKTDVDSFLRLDLTEEEKELISFKNATKILNI